MGQVTERLRTALAQRYVIERELGQGGMATVYLANDLKHDRKVAIKVLRSELAAVLGAERFVQEIRTTAHLQHPHILPLFDSGEADGFLYYVMPYIEGETLREKLNRERQLGIEESVRIAVEVADALEYAHEQGVIHRDIKPENILLQGGRAIVADFGIALAVSAAAGGRMTETGLSLGTPHYMSPEQATAEKEITARSDVYSLASVLYEMLTGEPPHTGATAQGIIMKIVTEEAAPVTRIRKSVPSNVAEAIATALEKLPADRFSTAATFAEALEAPAFTRARGPGAAPPGARTVRTGDWRVLAAVAVVAATLAGGAGWMLGRDAPAPAVVGRQRILLGNGPQLVSEMVAFRVGLHPRGAGILFGDTTHVGGRTAITAWWKGRGDLEATAVPSLDGAISPTFSPDGEWIVFVQGGDLRKQPLRGGNSVTLVSGVAGGTAHALAWLDDGTIVFENSNFILQRISETGQGRPDTVAVEAETGQPIHMTGLPGGGAALVSACVNSCPAGTRLSLLDLDADTVVPLAQGVVRAWPAPDGYVIYLTRTGGVFAARLDRGQRSLGPPTPLFEGVRVSTDANGEMHVAPDGSALFVRGSAAAGYYRPVRVDRAGRASATGLAAVSGSSQPYTSVVVSPDGRRLALTISAPSGEQLWVGELAGGPLVPLTPNETSASRPAWIANGARIAYVSLDGRRHIRSVRADGTSMIPDTLLTDVAAYEVAFTPGGDTMLVRVNSTTGNADVVLGTTGGRGQTEPLLASPFTETAIDLSPDGHWLAYVSNISGANEVYVRPFPDIGTGQVPISLNGGVEPVWARSGRELFYRDGSGWMVAAEISTDSAFTVVRRTRLFDASGFATHGGWRGYDVLADDQAFVMLQPGPGGFGEVGDLVLVDNLFEELRLALRR